MNTTVPVGITSKIGYLIALVAAVPTAVSAIEGAAAVTGPQKWTAAASIIVVAITKIGRYVQACIMAKGQPAETLPTLAEEKATPPS